MKRNLTLLVAAGGTGSRFGQDKLFASFRGEPLFLSCLRSLLPLADECILVSSRVSVFQEAMQAVRLPELDRVRFAPGGATRQESVWNGLRMVSRNAEYVAVQDAARPLTTAEILQRCLASAEKNGSGVAAHRVVDTIQVADPEGKICATPDRSSLWAAETPQVFRADWLKNGYEYCRKNGCVVTDDADAVRRAGFPVYLVENPDVNPKVTRLGDLSLAEALSGFPAL